VSLAIFYQELESLLSRTLEGSQFNALSGRFVAIERDLAPRFSDLMKDAADWGRSNGFGSLSEKLNEIAEEEKFRAIDASQLEAKIRRAMRAFRTFGRYSPEEEYKKQIEDDEQISGRITRKSVDEAEPQAGQVSSSSKHLASVFVVHGHDDSTLHQVMRLLAQMGIRGIVLREEPSQGRAIIEKLEHYSDVGFAVILMTADDLGGSAEEVSRGRHRPRARQNVILELGYFAAKLGRKRLCVLKEDGVEEPSDILGIVYTEIDRSGAWRLTLGKELKAAGFNIDLNRL